MSDKENLKNWLMQFKYVRTSQILAWGTKFYSNRADRNARVLREEGFLRRLDGEETARVFGETKELGYEVMKTDPSGQGCLL